MARSNLRWRCVERSEYGEMHQLIGGGEPLATVYPSGSWVAEGLGGPVYGRAASTAAAKVRAKSECVVARPSTGEAA